MAQMDKVQKNRKPRREREREREREMEIHHFSHHHGLVLRDVKNWENALCRVCTLLVKGFAYCCAKCYDFIIHKSCAELPGELGNPFHPQHSLTLLARPPYKSGLIQCAACGNMSTGFTFHCSECKYDLDVHCAGLIPTKGKINQHLINHPHPLIRCDKKKGFDVYCTCCVIPIINGPIYVCLECKVVLDESCARLPQNIQHLFHPEHPLTLFSQPHSLNKCNACGKFASRFFYRCSECDFDLDVCCASLMPTSNKHDEHHGEEHVTHGHPLICCDKPKNFLQHFSCSGCLLPFEEEDSVYVCLLCYVIFDKSCAHLPSEMEHPFHPTHPLTLLHDMSGMLEIELCVACKNKCEGLVYCCRVCRIYLHIRCLLPFPPIINSEMHKHPIALLNSENYFLGRHCSICNLECYIPIFRCVECNFSVHLKCYLDLPLVVEHKCHLHNLTLTYSPIKDHEDEDDTAEFYCDACEEHRTLRDPTYYCSECHYVAHVHCVISEIWPYLQRKSSLLGETLRTKDKAGAKLESDEREEGVEVLVKSLEDATEELRNINVVGDPILDELDVEIAALQRGLDELKTQEEELAKQLEALTTQFERKTMKMDKVKERRDQYLLSLQKINTK